MALNIFFRNTDAPTDVLALSQEDFHNKDTSRPIEITATFHDLGLEAETDLKAYVRQKELVVTSRAAWDPASASAEVRQFGSRLVIKDFARYFEADDAGAKAPELKEIFKDIRDEYPEVESATAKDAMYSALRAFEELHSELCEAVESADQFYGWSRGVSLLSKHIQWVYLPAVKDPAGEQDEQRNSALGKLLQRSVRSTVDFSNSVIELRRDANQKYQEMLHKEHTVLSELSAKIQESLRIWAHPGARVELNWHYDERKSVTVAEPFARAAVGEGEFLGEIVRAGHGVQRSFLVALLQVLAESGDGTSPTLILGFEEPELYQHPPQAKHLASVLEELSRQRAQVVLTTHSPYFVASNGYESIRLFRIPTGAVASKLSVVDYATLANRLAVALGCTPVGRSALIAAVEQIMQPSQNEMFFCRLPIFVEGPEDVALISTWIKQSGHWPEFRRLGCHFVVCEGKTNMSRPLAIAVLLELPAYVVFDGDCDKAEDTAGDQHVRDNDCILSLAGESAAPFASDCFFGKRVVMWRTRILDVIREELGDGVWDGAEEHARARYGLQQGVRRKNPILLTATLERLLEQGIAVPRLDKLGTGLLEYARAAVD